MVVTNSNNLNNILRIVNGKRSGTLFVAKKRENFKLEKYLK